MMSAKRVFEYINVSRFQRIIFENILSIIIINKQGNNKKDI